MKTDIEIAQEAALEHISDVAASIGIEDDDLEYYGKYKAKLSDELWDKIKDNKDGKLVLVTAINPTPAGEGKTTTTVGLGQAMAKLNKKALIALREPSLGPCFGIKGGAAGGGYAQVVPMEDLNLHFTGDFHAITSANNLLAAMLDNHIQQGNALRIDPRQVVWKRCLDMNDRVLRNIVVGLGNKMDGMVREDHFVITVASEIMAILCLLKPDAVVLVATVRALKYNGGVPKADLAQENLDALAKGIVNLEKHIENIQKYDVPVIVTLNSFVTDTEAENEFIRRFCEDRGCEFALSEVWEKGGEGGIALAEKVLYTLENKESHFHPLYEDGLSIREKIEKVAREIYGADGVVYEPAAQKQIDRIEAMGFASFPVCMAKNQYSLSDDAKKLGRPSGFDIHIREVYVSAGAGFVVALTGAIMTMPGLPKVPAANGIDVTEDGKITGLF